MQIVGQWLRLGLLEQDLDHRGDGGERIAHLVQDGRQGSADGGELQQAVALPMKRPRRGQILEETDVVNVGRAVPRRYEGGQRDAHRALAPARQRDGDLGPLPRGGEQRRQGGEHVDERAPGQGGFRPPENFRRARIGENDLAGAVHHENARPERFERTRGLARRRPSVCAVARYVRERHGMACTASRRSICTSVGSSTSGGRKTPLLTAVRT
jgi:hypothetical protein